MDNSFSLFGKTILIFGADFEGARVCALRFAFAGAVLVVVGRDKEKLDSLKNEISGEGHSFIVGDFVSSEDIEKLSLKIPPLDGILYYDFSAGTGASLSNFLAEFVKSGKVSEGGALVAVCKNAACFSNTTDKAEPARSEATCRDFIRQMGETCSRNSIRINLVLSDFQDFPEDEKFPLMGVSAENVADAVQFLLSKASSRITGNVLVVGCVHSC